jgi:hypothetical protein
LASVDLQVARSISNQKKKRLESWLLITWGGRDGNQESRKMIWAGRVMSTIVVLFLLLDAVMKLLKPAIVVEATRQLGYPENTIVGIGIVLLTCVVLFTIPRTSILGAILLTGYLGGAVATHVRLNNPLFSHILFPVYLGLLIWGGLYFRNRRLRALIPLSN